jgi:hypothetical protein
MDIPKNAYKHMEDKVEEIALIYRIKGFLTEEDMGAANINSIDLDHHPKPKDQRVHAEKILRRKWKYKEV